MHQRHHRIGIGILTASMTAALLLGAAPTEAQDRPPEGLLDSKPATEGKTDVATTGFEKVTRPKDDDKDGMDLKASAGGLFSSGNSRAISLTGAGRFRLRLDQNQVSAAAAGNFARAAEDPDAPMETTLENLQGRVRYDRFFTELVAGFLAVSANRNRFQGLRLRLNVDPGIALYFIDKKSHRLWTETGYDLQHDIRRQDAINAALREEGERVDKTNTSHNARLFAGYDNNVNEAVTFNTGIEYIQGIQHTENWRLVWDVGLTSNVGKQFAIATTFNLKYDHNPLPTVVKTDAITAISMVYSLL